MLLPEPRLETLVDQLRSMRSADRRAVLARLAAGERRRIRSLLHRDKAERAAHVSPFSADIAARFAALNKGEASMLTSAARKALAEAIERKGPQKAVENTRPTSLLDVLNGLMRPRRNGQ